MEHKRDQEGLLDPDSYIAIQRYDRGAESGVVWCKHEGTEFRSQHSPEKPGVMVDTVIPELERQRRNDPSGLLASQSNSVVNCRLCKRPCFKNRWGTIEGDA